MTLGAVAGVLAMVAFLVLRWRMSRTDRPSPELRDARAAAADQ